MATHTYFKFWKIGDNLCEFIVEGLLGKLDLSCVELSYPRDLVVPMYHCRGLPLSLRQNYVNKVLQ